MPYNTDKLALKNPIIKRSVKLLPCQKEMIRYWYKKGMSITSIAKLFKVSKRTVQFELFPERKQKNLEDREKRGGWKQYYNKQKHAKYTNEHRRYKHETLNN